MNALMQILTDNRLDSEETGCRWHRITDDFTAPALFNRERAWLPAIDMTETEKAYVVKAEVPGIDKNEIDITMTDGVLTIKGEKKRATAGDKDICYFREIAHGSFSRSLMLPEDASAEEVDATYANGVIKVTVPKKEAARPKKISVN